MGVEKIGRAIVKAAVLARWGQGIRAGILTSSLVGFADIIRDLGRAVGVVCNNGADELGSKGARVSMKSNQCATVGQSVYAPPFQNTLVEISRVGAGKWRQAGTSPSRQRETMRPLV